ncbi:Kinesin-like protein [Phytophthora rubi]|uniref:Kinesin-like protein n=1 Tax=Phytophthora rubi TaxID=129364 RepID=A0A6A3LCS9_9STRA|nr:Kinesin-like protein [Phytophthora rubi]KAE9330383.1 Kinesin-like protein [Phytophthora rubi]
MDASETAGASGGSGKDKETVKVVVRCRPLFGKELVEGRKSIVTLDSAAALISLKCPDNGQIKSFTFDSVYDESTSQRQFYDESGYPLVESIFDGYNGTIFAYGQTGCGKTHTMQGKDLPPELRGVIPLSFDHIFDTINADTTREYMVRASYLEIYNEDIRDLLSDDAKKKLGLKESADGTVYVKDLTEVVVRDVESMNNVMNRGFKNRTVGATLMNEGSSRSHSIFTVVVETNETIGGQDHFKAGKLNLVDLAGSERQSKTGATGNRLKEGCKINLSLSALGNVISALVDGKGKHIPYRDSKLTRLLQDSLGGNTKTLMVAAVSPADYNYDETLSTLRYANRAKNIKNKPVVNEDPKDAKLREYKEEIERLRKMLESQSQSRGGELGSSSGMGTPSRPLSPRSGSGSGSRSNGTEDLAKEREEIAKYQQEAAEMLECAKHMMDEANALQTQHQRQQTDPGSDASTEIQAQAGKRKTSGVLGNLPPLLGLFGKQDQQMTPGRPRSAGNNSMMTSNGGDVVTSVYVAKGDDAAIKQAMQEAAQIDAQAKAMMVKAEEMMKEAAQRQSARHVEVVVKEVIPDTHVKERDELRELNQTILNQRDRIGQELEQTQVAMEAYVREKEMLHAKLKKIESHILGGASGSSSTRGSISAGNDADSEVTLLKQQVEYRRAQIKLREKAKKQAKNEAMRRALELEKQQVEEELKTAQEAAQASLAAARKKEAKYKAKLEATRQEIADLNSEFERERENMLDTIREQTKEAKLLEQLVELFLPQNELVKVWERAVWSEEREEWNLPKLKPRSDFHTIKLPTLPLGGGGGSAGIESGGAEVVSDDEDNTRQGSAGAAGNSTVRSSGSSSSAKRRKSGVSRQASHGGAIIPYDNESLMATHTPATSSRLPSAVHTSRPDSKAVTRGVSPHNSSNGSKERQKHKDKTSGPSVSRQPQEDQEQPQIAGAYEAPGAGHYFPAEEDLLAPLSAEYQPRDRLQSRQGSRQDSRQEKNRRTTSNGGNSRGAPSGLGQLDHTPPSIVAATEKTRSSSRGDSGGRQGNHRHHRHRDRKDRQQDDEAGAGNDEWVDAGDGTLAPITKKKSSKHSKKKNERRDKSEPTENDEDTAPPTDSTNEHYSSLRRPSFRSLDDLL